MATTAKITSKGQITIPVEVRKRLGVKRGDHVEFVADGERTVVKSADPLDNPFLKDVGIFPDATASAIAWVRDMRDDEWTAVHGL